MSEPLTPPLAETLKELRQLRDRPDICDAVAVMIARVVLPASVSGYEPVYLAKVHTALPALLTAAEQSETLRAENERLRRALRSQVDICPGCGGTGLEIDTETDKPCPCCAAARKALETP